MRTDKAEIWEKLHSHSHEIKKTHLRDFLDGKNGSRENFRISLEGLRYDFSRHWITRETINLLCLLAKSSDLDIWMEKMFSGDVINTSENRAVLHTALRLPDNEEVFVDGKNVVPEIYKVRKNFSDFAEKIRSGHITGYTGKPFKHVVNIGIGGSCLGPEIVCKSLSLWEGAKNAPKIHFLANVDGHAADIILKECRPEETLFIVASKTFTTQETLMNAETARNWIVSHLGEEAVGNHFCAVSTNLQAVMDFGISGDRMFPFWEWVGGRFSLWSSIGLPVCIAIGDKGFEMLCRGAHVMDMHFRHKPFDQNIPVLMGLLGIWYRNVMGASSHAVLPYDQRLDRFPAYLQQLDMESNGKTVSRDEESLDIHTGPVIFGEPGTNGQHAFYQLLHQGSDLIPCDFIAVTRPDHDHTGHHLVLLANMIAQAEALARGRPLEESENTLQKTFPGNRPSSIFMMDSLSPYNLGMLIAAYEHKIFVQGVIWNINSFDQWGVELGKTLTKKILSTLPDEQNESADQKILNLVKKYGLS